MPKSLSKTLCATAFTILCATTAAKADFVVLNGNHVVERSSIGGHFFVRDNLVHFQVYFGPRVNFEPKAWVDTYRCNERWNWPEIEQASSLIANHMNTDKMISIFGLLHKAGFECTLID